MRFEETIPIKMNGTILIIGRIMQVYIEDDNLVGTDGYIALSDADILISQGLDAYFVSRPVGRLPYAKPSNKNE